MRRRPEFDAAAVELLDALEARGVDCLLLKGPVLARLLYTPGEHRGYSDVDVLVSSDGMPDARGALTSLGYLNASPTAIFGVDDVGEVQHAETWNRRGREGPLLIDLHWRIPGCEAPPEVCFQALRRHRAWLDLEGRRAPIPDKGGLAFHLATHAAQHGAEDRKAMADLDRGLERWPLEVWRSAADLAEEIEGVAAFAAGLRLHPAGEVMAEELRLPTTDRRTWEILNRDARPRGTFHLEALAEAHGIRGRANVLRRSLFPTRRWITRQYPWAERGPLRLMAAYGAHLLRAPGWALRAWRYRRRARRAGS